MRVCVCVRGYYERTTGAKHNSGGEKNMVGLAHSRASRYHTVTNKKWERCTELDPCHSGAAFGRLPPPPPPPFNERGCARGPDLARLSSLSRPRVAQRVQ